jgi:anti-anti-sigma factor
VEYLSILPMDDPPGLRLVGELDLATVPALEDALAACGTSRPMTLDISDLTFMDVVGARCILRHALALDGVGPLVLDGAGAMPLRVLQILGFTDEAQIRIRSISPVPSDG